MDVFRFEKVISSIYDLQEIVQFKSQSYSTFLWHVKNSPHNDKYVNIFTLSEPLLQNAIKIFIKITKIKSLPK